MMGLIAIWMLPLWTIGMPMIWVLVDRAMMPAASTSPLRSRFSADDDRPSTLPMPRHPVGAH